MRKYYFVIYSLFIFSIYTLGQTDKQLNFKINGTINADTGTLHLYFFPEYTSNAAQEVVAQVTNSRFSFSGTIYEPQSVFVILGERYRSSNFIIEQGEQTMTIDVNTPNNVPEVKNQIMLNDYPAYEAFFKPMKTKWDVFYMKDDSLQAVYQYDIPIEVKEKLNREYNMLCNSDNELLLAYSKENPDSHFAFWRLVRLMNWGYEPIYDSVFANFSDKLKNGYAGTILNKKLCDGKVLSVGNNFPSFPCTDINGNTTLIDAFKGNRFTLVDFWFSRCAPCRAQFNALRSIYSQFNDKGFEIAGISIDKANDKENLEQVIQSEKLGWKHYWDTNGAETRKLSINAFPTNFLIDQKGKIVAKNISLGELEIFLNNALTPNNP